VYVENRIDGCEILRCVEIMEADIGDVSIFNSVDTEIGTRVCDVKI